MKKVGIILSGCGFLDGSEIQECVLTLLALSKFNVQVEAFAPSDNQKEVIDHLSKSKSHETRNILVEAARIVRSDIKSLEKARCQDLDALVIPGGFGVAKNLCNFAEAKAAMKVHPLVERLISDMHGARKPIGAICIAPILLAKVLGFKSPQLTLGKDEDLTGSLAQWGAQWISSDVDEVVVDEANKLVTTPAFMLDRPLHLIEKGIMKMVQEILHFA